MNPYIYYWNIYYQYYCRRMNNPFIPVFQQRYWQGVYDPTNYFGASQNVFLPQIYQILGNMQKYKALAETNSNKIKPYEEEKPLSVKTLENTSEKSKKTKHTYKVSDFTSEKLTENDLEQIVTTAGTGIEDIYDLSAGQLWMLGKSGKGKSAFFLQLLFKAVIPLKASEFRQRLDMVCEKRENLRSEFRYSKLGSAYRVVYKNRTAELKFEDLSYLDDEQLEEKLKNLMVSDRRRGFDLERDPLLRISVYKTNGKDNYAIIVSQPHINTDGISMLHLIKDLFIDYALELSGIEQEIKEVSYKDYAKWLESRNTEAELDYWRELLQDLPPLTHIPGVFVQSSAKSAIASKKLFLTENVSKELSKKQSAYHATLNSIMQAAWSIVLMNMYHTSDVTFGAVTSGRDAQVQNSAMMSGGFINALPVRAKISSQDIKLSEFISQIQTQFMTSLQHSHCSPEEIGDSIGRKEPIFDHLLNFHNFSSAVSPTGFTEKLQIPGIQLLGFEMFDDLSMDLTIYFVNENGNFGFNFVYNQNSITEMRIDILAKVFADVTEQIAAADENTRVCDIKCPDMSVFDKAFADENEQKREITGFISGLDLMDGVEPMAAAMLAEEARIISYSPDDIIKHEKQPSDSLMFVYDGFVELCKKSGDGWIHTLMTLKNSKLISAAGIWGNDNDGIEARSIYNARVLEIPSDAVRKVIAAYPEIAMNLINELNKRIKSLSLLLVNS